MPGPRCRLSHRRLAAVIVLFVGARVFAQDRVQPPGSTNPPAGGIAGAVPAPSPSMSAEEAIASARAMFDRIDSGDEEVTWQELSDELSRYVAVVQAHDPKSPWLFYLWGRGFALGGRRGDAIKQLDRFIETREGRNEWTVHLWLGDLFVEEFPRLAQANYQKAAALKANEPSVLLGLSRCADKIGKPEEAIRLAKEAVEADGRRTVRYLAHLAKVLQGNHKFDEAEQSARAALSIAQHELRSRPGQSRPLRVLDAQYQLLSEILLKRINEPATASRIADDCLRLTAIMRERTTLAVELSWFEQLRVLEAGIVRTNPDNPPKLVEEYARTLAEVGRAEQAISAFEKLLELDPANAAAKEALEQLKSEPSAPGSGELP